MCPSVARSQQRVPVPLCGTGWTSAEIVETASSITGCSLQFGPDGKVYLVYGSTEMRLAIRDPGSAVWTVQVVEASPTGSLRNSVRGRPLMTPTGLAYGGPAEIGYAAPCGWRYEGRLTRPKTGVSDFPVECGAAVVLSLAESPS